MMLGKNDGSAAENASATHENIQCLAGMDRPAGATRWVRLAPSDITRRTGTEQMTLLTTSFTTSSLGFNVPPTFSVPLLTLGTTANPITTSLTLGPLFVDLSASADVALTGSISIDPGTLALNYGLDMDPLGSTSDQAINTAPSLQFINVHADAATSSLTSTGFDLS